jgi:oligopeptide/dipeptide ABC transporter ATP-binding protein
MTGEILRASGLTAGYARRPVIHDITLALPDRPEGVGLIGESGSGKTTIALALLGLLRPYAGRVAFRGRDLRTLDRAGRARYRGEVQPVFQDGTEALDPRLRVAASIREARRAGVDVPGLLADVGLDPALATRRPHELSSGQRQRVSIARALAVGPKLLILDEPTSALDMTVQARILDLLERLRAEHDLSYLLITHNLALVDRLCATAHVLFAGRLVESGPADRLLRRPSHPYTLALRAAVPKLGEPLARGAGAPEMRPAETGCPYRLRCPFAVGRCAAEFPATRRLEDGRTVACHRAEDVLG